jgi:hypothetical protein
LRGVTPVRSQTYEITFTGQAGPTLRAQFDDCQVTLGPGTTLRAELPDPAALAGLIQRITSLRLEVLHLRLITPHPPQTEVAAVAKNNGPAQQVDQQAASTRPQHIDAPTPARPANNRTHIPPAAPPR